MRSSLLDLSVAELVESASKKAKHFGQTRVLLPPKTRTLRDAKIETLLDHGFTAPQIYQRLYEQNLIRCPNTGNFQAYRSIVVLVSRIRYAKGAEKANYGRIRKFQRMKNAGFNNRRIMSQMNMTKYSYDYMTYNYWHSEGAAKEPETKIKLKSNIVKKAVKMMRLGYTKRKIMKHLGLATPQYNYIQSDHFKGSERRNHVK